MQPLAMRAPLLDGFTPQRIGGLVLWLAADRITGLADGAAIVTWTDLSGTGHDATQATGSKQPLYKTNILNGLPGALFDGTDDVMSAVPGSSAVRSIFIV